MAERTPSLHWRPAIPNMKDGFENQRTTLMGLIFER
jgi:hypothetical protein